MDNGEPMLVVIADLEDVPANRSMLNLAAALARQVPIRLFVGADGPLREAADSIGPVTDASAVNAYTPARLAARARLAPVGSVLKNRRLRSLVEPLGEVRTVLVAGPESLPLLDWLPAGDRRVGIVLGEPGSVRSPAVRQLDVVVGEPTADLGQDGPRVVDAGLLLDTPGSPTGEGLTVAVAGLGEDRFERFVEVARSIRRSLPDATVAWVRPEEDGERWDWALYGRGDLIDLTGSVVSMPASGEEPVDAVVTCGDGHPLVALGAAIAGRPVVDEAGIDGLADLLGDESVGTAPEALLDRHDVHRVAPRVLDALTS